MQFLRPPLDNSFSDDLAARKGLHLPHSVLLEDLGFGSGRGKIFPFFQTSKLALGPHSVLFGDFRAFIRQC
jgi:hypothetical protein